MSEIVENIRLLAEFKSLHPILKQLYKRQIKELIAYIDACKIVKKLLTLNESKNEYEDRLNTLTAEIFILVYVDIRAQKLKRG